MFHYTMDNSRSTGQLNLTGDLTIRNAINLKDALSNAMEQIQTSKASQLELNFSEVERMDLTTLQTLCAAHRSLIKQGIALTLAGPLPTALRETVQQAGFVDCGGKKETSGLWMGVKN
ncbi:MAG: STAS domain-containing protein [Magnetococcus sp. YQC-5]